MTGGFLGVRLQLAAARSYYDAKAGPVHWRVKNLHLASLQMVSLKWLLVEPHLRGNMALAFSIGGGRRPRCGEVCLLNFERNQLTCLVAPYWETFVGSQNGAQPRKHS